MKKQFIPNKQADVMNQTADYYAKISAPGFDPATVGLKPADVTRFVTKYAAAQGAFSDRNVSKDTKKSKTGIFSGPNGAFDQLVEEMRYQGNLIRVSDAPDGTCLDLGVDRRSPTHTPRTLTQDPPEFSVDSVKNGVINVRFRTAGSGNVRARAENSKGVLVAVVNAANPPVAGEADTVPTKQVPRSPAKLDSTHMPSKVRLYARWVSERGETSSWSSSVEVTVLN